MTYKTDTGMFLGKTPQIEAVRRGACNEYNPSLSVGEVQKSFRFCGTVCPRSSPTL